MTTVALLRTTYLNVYLQRTDGALLPWTDAHCNSSITDALTQLWQSGIGIRASGTVATSQASDVYTVPTALQAGRVSRIELEQSSGGVSGRVGRVTSWQPYSDTQVRISPVLPTDATLLLRFFGWAPFNVTGSDLPVRLESAVAMKAASLAFGLVASQLVNSQRQQGLDSGRVVDYPSAMGFSAYWERRYNEVIRNDQSMMSIAPRRARR